MIEYNLLKIKHNSTKILLNNYVTNVTRKKKKTITLQSYLVPTLFFDMNYN